MRAKIVAGNWKMNNTLEQTQMLIESLKEKLKTGPARVMIAPSFTNLCEAKALCKGSAIEVIAQNMHFARNGAYTGEISAEMLKSVGINTVILGHSERRTYFGETDAILAKKVNRAIEEGFKILFCIGEVFEERKSNKHFETIKRQLEGALFQLDAKAWEQISIAYEPVWAIGTGETASPEQAQEMHAFIRTTIAQKHNQALADKVSILYGGSVKPSNAKDIFSKPDVDGGLIGGASLNADDFLGIVNSM